ncbi:DUF6207 family protein (plasmid) [Streptomyces canus]|uniref:DUF6207 family protein n=1 Tax=Streptomyces canus TaxID=58343 RepID=UPI002F919EF0
MASPCPPSGPDRNCSAKRCAIALADRTTREPGEPGVRLRCLLDLRRHADA